MSLRFFDLLNSVIYDLKRSIGLRWLFDPVLHSSLDDLVVLTKGAKVSEIDLERESRWWPSVAQEEEVVAA